MTRTRSDWESAARDPDRCHCGRRDCEDCAYVRGLVKQLEREGWRVCEQCGEFSVSPEQEPDVCVTCTALAAHAEHAIERLGLRGDELDEDGTVVYATPVERAS